MISSFETINKKLKNNILFLLKSRIDKIISDESLIEKLENKIKFEVEKWAKNLINSLDIEIKNSFPKYFDKLNYLKNWNKNKGSNLQNAILKLFVKFFKFLINTIFKKIFNLLLLLLKYIK